MKYKVSSVKFTGNSGEGGWAQVHEFASIDVEKLKARGHLFAVFASSNSGEGVEGVVAGRELLTRLHEEYFGSIAQKPFNAVKGAVAKVATEFRGHWGDVEIAVVCKVNDVIYAAASGGASVRIFRNGMLAPILESKKTSTASASGFPQENDILILATSGFVEVVADGSVKAALKGGELGFAQELLSPTIRSNSDSGKVAVSFMKFESKSKRDKLAEKISKKKFVEEKTVEKKRLTSRINFKNISSKFSKKLPGKKIYIRREIQDVEVHQNRKMAVSVGVILLALLMVSIGFGIRQKNVKETKELYTTKLESAKHEYNEAVEISSLNPDRARELFVSSRQKVFELTEDGVEDPEVESLKQSIEKGVEEILGEYSVDSELFLDLSLLADGFAGDEIVASEETLYVLDKQGGRIVSVAVETKRSEVVAGPSQVDNTQTITAYSGRVFVMTDDGVYEVGDDKTKLFERDWGGDSKIFAYAGNLYVLVKQGPDIIRFAGVNDEFSSGKSWLSSDQNLDFSEVVSWCIDGVVWMITNSGQVLKFSLGNYTNFEASGLFPELTTADWIYTNESLDYLYILESERGRVIVLTKEGDYKAQYLLEKANEANGFFVSEENNKLILLSEDKLYQMELKHL